MSPFLLALYPVFAIFASNIEQTSYRALIIPILVVLAFTALLVVLLNLLVGKRKAALAVSLFLIAFFSFGYIRDGLAGTFIDRYGLVRDRYILAILGSLTAIWWAYLFRTKRNLSFIGRTVNFAACVLILLPLGQISFYEIKSWRSARLPSAFDTNTVLPNTVSGTRPDIYYIILDGYARDDELMALYGFDNSAFIGELEKRGFFVARKSRSNYAQTFLSLASSLNMEHVNFLTSLVGKDSSERTVPYGMIEKNKVQQFLKSQGYNFVHVSSGSTEMTSTNRFADVNLKSGKIDEFSLALLETTAIYPFVRRSVEADARGRILYAFDALARVSEFSSPRFTFAHIVIPHSPYVFGPNGERVKNPKLQLAGDNYWKFKKYYVDQVIFANKKTLAMLDTIFSKEKMPPIIIIQGDHGSASQGEGSKGLSRLTPNIAKERFKILNAYYLPGGSSQIIYDSITPVNSFRLIFNHYFGTKFDRLEDASYFSTDIRPYDFTDVTDIASEPYSL